MKTRFGRGSSNDLYFRWKNRYILTVVTKPPFPPLPVFSYGSKTSVQFRVALCLSFFIFAHLSSPQPCNHYFYWQCETGFLCCFCHFQCISLSIRRHLSLSVCFFFFCCGSWFQFCSLSFSVTFSTFVAHHKHRCDRQQQVWVIRIVC